MNKPDKSAIYRRCLLFTAGIALYGFSVGLMAVPAIGVSPISSISYCLTFLFDGMSLGAAQLIVNVLMVVLQIALLGKSFSPTVLLQIPVSIVFSLVIDATMPLARSIGGISSGLAFRVCMFLASLPVMAMGLSLLLRAGNILLPGDGVALAVARKTGKPFGYVKVWTDCSCVALTCVISAIFLGRIVGVQIGTLVAALTLGRMVRLISDALPRVSGSYN